MSYDIQTTLLTVLNTGMAARRESLVRANLQEFRPGAVAQRGAMSLSVWRVGCVKSSQTHQLDDLFVGALGGRRHGASAKT